MSAANAHRPVERVELLGPGIVGSVLVGRWLRANAGNAGTRGIDAAPVAPDLPHPQEVEDR